MAGTYGTTELAAAIMGDDAVEANRKGATRTLRKFLRDDMGEGKAVVGKGGRYALELKAAELRAMKKRFDAWVIAQEEAKAARAEALNARKAPAEAVEADTEGEGSTDAPEDADDTLDAVEGPSDDEIAAMLADD